MRHFILSVKAEEDFERLFEYGIDNFGVVKAKKFSAGLKERLSEITENPFHWHAVDYIRTNYLRSVYRNHSIYYIVESDIVARIVRILNKEDIYTSLN